MKIISLIAILLIAPAITVADDFDDIVGWYETAPNERSLVTWGATGGLRVFDFDSHRFEKLTAAGAGSFVWNRDSATRQVSFVRNSEGRVTALRWRDQNGSEETAKRIDHYGYSQKEIRFKSGDTALVGLLMMPQSRGPHPAAAIIHGSGTSDRDNVWAFSIANHLALNGCAVLLPDKRGSGKSGGDWHTANFNLLAQDALAALGVLKSQSEVDRKKMGLVGLSQGGWIAPLAASISKDVKFVIDVSGASVTVREQVIHEIIQTFRQRKVPESDIEIAKEIFPLSERYMKTGTGWEAYQAKLERAPFSVRLAFIGKKDDWRWNWYKEVFDFDPIPYWQRLDAPVLVVFGEEDEYDNVPVKESVARLERLAKNGRDITIKVYPDSGHAIADAATHWIRKDFLELLISWTEKKMKWRRRAAQ
ncbi:MAG TPA: alpha/beta fold hydrolase [Blastocatellia bacterium]